jgi:hypothetical protein
MAQHKAKVKRGNAANVAMVLAGFKPLKTNNISNAAISRLQNLSL